MATLSREQRLNLLQRSDGTAFWHLARHWGAIVITTSLIIWRVPGWQALLVVQGLLIISNFALLHESIHKTAFKTLWLNTWASNICGLLVMVAPVWFRHFHTDHHRYTNDPAKDPELITPRPRTMAQYLAYMSGIPAWIAQVRSLFANALSTNRDAFVHDQEKSAVRREAWVFLCIYAALVAGSVYSNNTVLIWIWLVPVLIGQPFLRAFLLAEHGGCPMVDNMLANSRTTYTTGLARFLAWNMPYHAEHHTFPAVPFHNLPKFHDLTRDHLAVTENGYGRFHQRFAQNLLSGEGSTNEVI